MTQLNRSYGIKKLISFYNNNIENQEQNNYYSKPKTSIDAACFPSKAKIQSHIDKINKVFCQNSNQIIEPFENKKFYHITNYEAVQHIKKEGFRAGRKGMLGGGIYFAERPWCAYRKALCGSNDVLIVALLKIGRCLTERHANTQLNLNTLNSMGYDSVQMRHCKTGIEICLYEPSRIKILDIYYYHSEDDSTIRYYHENDISRIIEFSK